MGGTGGRSNQDGVILRDRSRTGPAPDTKSDNSSSPGGTVERVALTMPAEFTVAGSPITKSGTLAVMRNPAAANTVLAGPVSGSDATPAMRALVLGDLPQGESGSFVPTMEFSSPGSSSFAYTIQQGRYTRIGKMVVFQMRVAATITLGTGSGFIRFGPLPFTPEPDPPFRGICQLITSSVTWPTGTTQLHSIHVGGTALMGIESIGSGATRTGWTSTQFPNGAARDVIMSGSYLAVDP